MSYHRDHPGGPKLSARAALAALDSIVRHFNLGRLSVAILGKDQTRNNLSVPDSPGFDEGDRGAAAWLR